MAETDNNTRFDSCFSSLCLILVAVTKLLRIVDDEWLHGRIYKIFNNVVNYWGFTPALGHTLDILKSLLFIFFFRPFFGPLILLRNWFTLVLLHCFSVFLKWQSHAQRNDRRRDQRNDRWRHQRNYIIREITDDVIREMTSSEKWQMTSSENPTQAHWMLIPYGHRDGHKSLLLDYITSLISTTLRM